VALLFTVRPIVTKYFKTNKVATNSDKLVGKTCKVTKEIEVGERGYVKVDGKEWSAVSNGKSDLMVGQVVRILAIDGNKLIVEEVE
jgi:membrane protein implicated in regulation of membrane protease activity